QLAQAVGELKERIQGSEPLRLHHGAHAISEQVVDLAAIRGGLVGSGKKGDKSTFREAGFAGGGAHDLGESGASCVKDLRRGGHVRKRSEQTLPGVVQLGAGNLPLPRQNLPKPYFRLEDADRAGSRGVVGDAIESLGYG